MNDKIVDKALGDVFTEKKEERKPETKYQPRREYVPPNRRTEFQGSWHKPAQEQHADDGKPLDIPPFLRRRKTRVDPAMPDYKLTTMEISRIVDACFNAVIDELDWNRIVLGLKDHDTIKITMRQVIERSAFMSGKGSDKRTESTLSVTPVKEAVSDTGTDSGDRQEDSKLGDRPSTSSN